MRVIAGKAGSLKLETVEGMGTRPTTDKIKETLFNMLQGRVGECRFLDLFSGSGGIAIEALSRGAKEAVLVEKDRKASACIRRNLQFTKLQDQARLMTTDIMSALNQLEGGEAFDIVFMDPPYDHEWEKKVLEKLSDSSLITPDTLIIVEASAKTRFDYLEDYGYEVIRRKDYKTNVHMFIRRMEK